MNSKFNIDLDRPSIGLNTSSDPFAFRDGEYSYLLNGTINNSDISRPFIRMINGNVFSFHLPAGQLPVCSFALNHKEICIFSVSPSRGISEIGLFDGKTYTTSVTSDKLGFKINRQIQCEGDEDFNGKKIIIWVQEDAPIRYMDLNNIPMLNGELDIDALNLFKKYQYPQAKVTSVTNNGRLPAGSYYVCCQYSDENSNGLTAWSTPVGPFYVYRDSSSQMKNYINGSPDKESTSKALNIQVDNLDQSFRYYNIGIIKSYNGIREAVIVTSLPTMQNTYTYTGAAGNEIPVDLKEIITPAVSYISAKTISRSNGSILIGNLKGREQYNFQPEISKIQVLWQSSRDKYVTVEDTYADPLAGAYRMSLRRNEVYSFGINIIWTDGTKSREYPLIGRQKNKYSNGNTITQTNTATGETIPPGEWDSFRLTPNDDIYEVGSSPERYTIFNTALVTGSDLVGPSGTGQAEYGEFGYWESTDRYPLDANVWGVNAGMPIRHFMAPDYAVCPLTDGENAFKDDKAVSYIYRIGLRFSNIEDIMNALPASIKSEIAGWELVRGDRRNNKTVIASGLLFNMWYQSWNPDEATSGSAANGSFSGPKDDIRLYPNYPLNDLRADNNIFKQSLTSDIIPEPYTMQDRYRKDVFSFVSPDTEFDKTKLLDGDLYIHQEYYGVAKTSMQYMQDYPRFKHNSGDDDYREIFYHTASIGYYNNFKKTVSGTLRRQLLENIYIPFDSVVAGGQTGIPVSNVTRDQTVLLYVHEDIKDPSIQDTSRANVSDSDFGCTMGKESVYRTASSYYGSIISRIKNQYGSVFDTRYVSTNFNSFNIKNNTIVYAGDCFIGCYGMSRQMIMYQNAESFIDFPDGSRGVDLKSSFTVFGERYFYTSVPKWIADNSNSECEPDGEGTNMIPMIYTGIPYFFAESDHNIDLQLNGPGENETFYPNLKDGSLSLQKWNSIKYLTTPKEHLVNRSYEEPNDLFAYENVDPFYDPSKSQHTHYNTRTIFSLTPTPENRVSNMLIFKPLNYYDFRKDTGDLWDIRDLGNNKILFRMEHALFMDRKYATIPIVGNAILLGSGKLFETEPVLLDKSDSGYLGTNSQWAFNNTPFGAFFIDGLRGSAIKFTEGPKDISLNGADSYLLSEMPLKLLKDLPFFKDFDNPANPNGIGFCSVYDNFNKMWILTKRDYEVIDKSTLGRFTYVDEKLLFDGGPVELSNTNIFANRSFTFCYNVLEERWTGWQSFVPGMYAVLQKEVYSFAEGAYWKHNVGLPRTFYGKRHPFIFEGVIRHEQGESMSHALAWITRAFKFKNFVQQGEDFDITFNKGVFYNLHQCTGQVMLTVQDENDLPSLFKLPDITNVSGENYLRKRERRWEIAELFDMVKDHNIPFFTRDPKAMESLFYVDKVLNHSNIDYFRKCDEAAILNDLWLKYRLIYDKEEDAQIYLYLTLDVSEQVIT